jgi:hypothetical protein
MILSLIQLACRASEGIEPDTFESFALLSLHGTFSFVVDRQLPPVLGDIQQTSSSALQRRREWETFQFHYFTKWSVLCEDVPEMVRQ